MLFSKFGVNYNKLPERFRKGSVLYRQEAAQGSTLPVRTASRELTGNEPSKSVDAVKNPRPRWEIVVAHRDIIGSEFWQEHPAILAG